MSVTDHITTAYKRIWTLLEADSNGFTSIFGVNNRIKLANPTETDDKPYPFKTTKSDDDFPEAALTVGDFTDSAFTLTDNFAYTTGFNPATKPWKERITQEYVLTLTMPDLRLRKLSQAEREAIKALLLGGPRWGRDWIKEWGPVRGTRLIGKSGDAAGTERLQSQMRIPVTMDFDGPSMLT